MGMNLKKNDINGNLLLPTSTHLLPNNKSSIQDEILRIKHKINEYEQFINSVFEDDSFMFFDIPSMQRDIEQLKIQLSEYELRVK